MLLEIFLFLGRHSEKCGDLKILFDFRRAREKNSTLVVNNLYKMQFEWGASASGLPADEVRRVVREWLFLKPLPHLGACRYPGVREFFSYLRRRPILIGVFSDYPSNHKLDAMELRADILVHATDHDVGRLKPGPKGLIVAAAKLNKPMGECIFIGDREDKDGECARRAGMPFLILNRHRRDSPHGFRNFFELTQWFERNIL